TAARIVTVQDVAPTATLSNGGAVLEGSAGTVSFSNQFDPSPPDVAAGFRYAYDFNDDGTFEIGDGTFSGSSGLASAVVPAGYLAEAPGSRSVRARIIDKDGGSRDYLTTITITNAVPTATIAGATDGVRGQVRSFT